MEEEYNENGPREGTLVSVPENSVTFTWHDLSFFSPEKEVNIDFEISSSLWRRNKMKNKGGSFVYRCVVITSNGKPCNRTNCKSAVHTRKRNSPDYW